MTETNSKGDRETWWQEQLDEANARSRTAFSRGFKAGIAWARGELTPPSPAEKLPEQYAGDELYLGGFCKKCGRPTGRKDDVDACAECW